MNGGKVILGSLIAFIFFGILFLISSQPQLLSLMKISLISGGVFVGGIFVWLLIKKRLSFSISGLEIPILVFLASVLTSLVFSPAPLNGIERIAWFIAYIVWFYIILELYRAQGVAAVVRNGLLLISGILLLQVILETYVWYMGWWAAVGSRTEMPPFAYRFKGFFGSNNFMGFVNLCAPVALISFFKAKKLVSRTFFALWLVLYAVTVPFSSSRGGWLGTAAWIGSMTILWLAEGTRLNSMMGNVRRYWPRFVFFSLFAIALLSTLGLWFYNTFAASHPTHGSGIAINREHIWGGALALWKTSPLVGIGPGLVSPAFLNVTSSFPAGWWPKNAHSIPLQMLAEFGLFGFIAFSTLMISTLIALKRAYQASPAQDRDWKKASLAALASVFVHGLFDDFSWLPVIVGLFLLHAAAVLSNPLNNVNDRSIPIWALAVPALASAALGIYSLWAYTPLIEAISLSNSDWHKAALKTEEAVYRNPSLPFYKFQTGVAWSMNWQQNGDRSSLIRAVDRFKEVVRMEPSNSVAWANLAVLNWHSGNRPEALDAIHKAIRLSPKESSFYLNYGWFLEQSGQDQLAIIEYQKAMDLAPWTTDHPYWQGTAVRKAAISTFPEKEQPIPYWKQAAADLQNGDTAAYKKNIMFSEIYREPAAARLASLTASTTLQGTNKDEHILETLLWSVQSRYGYFYGDGYLYNSAYNRSGLSRMIVPGYIMVSENNLQFSGLEKLYEIQVSEENCSEALFTWEVLQRELHAGELNKAKIPSSSLCQPGIVESNHNKK